MTIAIVVATHALAELTAQVARKSERHLVESQFFRVVVILDLDAVVGVDAAPVRCVKVVVPEAVIIGEDVQPGIRSPPNLTSEPLPGVGGGVRLPSINDPRLNFQMVGRKNLNSYTLKKPRRVGRDIGGLISPVIEIVVAEQADVRHEDTGVDIHSVHP